MHTDFDQYADVLDVSVYFRYILIDIHHILCDRIVKYTHTMISCCNIACKLQNFACVSCCPCAHIAMKLIQYLASFCFAHMRVIWQYSVEYFPISLHAICRWYSYESQ